MKHLLIIGANGYVGNHLVQELLPYFRITGLVRGAHPMLKPVPGVTYVNASENLRFKADIIVNTSFSSAPDIQQNKLENTHMAELIRGFCHAHTRVIHLSSLVVFGHRTERKQVADLVPQRWDAMYAESKLHMEHELLAQMGNHDIQILRLGNVWGPGSMWLKQVADALILGKPVSYPGAWSNTIHIGNLCAYILFLTQHELNQQFHHVTDLHPRLWKDWIIPLAEVLNVSPTVIEQVSQTYSNPVAELISSFHPNPVRWLKRLKNGQYLHSRILHGMQQESVQKILQWKPTTPPPIRTTEVTDTALWHVLTTTTPFQPVMDPGFTEPFSYEAILQQNSNWIHVAGYPVKRH